MAVNSQGEILVQNTLGPRQAADKSYQPPGSLPDYELPPLQKLSDMMWMMWEYYVPADQRTYLNFIMSLSISNPESLSNIRRALDSQGQQLTTGPYMIDPTSEGGLALLGTYGSITSDLIDVVAVKIPPNFTGSSRLYCNERVTHCIC
jgi:hypothetical protein